MKKLFLLIFILILVGFHKHSLAFDELRSSNVLNMKKSHLMALASLASYSDVVAIEKLEKKLKDPQFIFLESKEKGSRDNEFINTETGVLVLVKENHVILSFRGTEINSFANIQTDLAARKVSWEEGRLNYGKVHIGFYKAMKTIWPEVEEALNMLELRPFQRFEVVFTGHSLGGAIAQLALKKFLQEKENGKFKKIHAKEYYSFGAPRVGDYDFVESLKRDALENGVLSYRFRNFNDPVTMAPAYLNIPFIGGYRHFGQLVYLDRNGNYIKNINDLDYTISNDWIELKPKEFWKNLVNHLLDHYISAIESNLKK